MSLDVVRSAAVFSVVGIHSLAPLVGTTSGLADALWAILWWSLPALFIVAGLLHGLAPDGGEPKWLLRRARALIPAYLLAAVGYLSYYQLKRMAGADLQPLDVSDAALRLLLGTNAAHLWFIPVLMECALIGWLVRRRPVLVPYAWTVAAAGAAMYVALQVWGGMSMPLIQAIYRTPLYWLFFYLLGMSWRARGGVSPRLAAGTALIGLALSAGYPALNGLEGAAGRAALWLGPAFLALGVVAVAVGRTRMASRAWLLRVSSFSLAVYLLHYAVVDAAYVLLGRFVGRAGLGLALGVWVLAYAVSIGLAYAVSLGLRVPRG